LYYANDRKKCNRHCKSFHKRLITLKNTWLEMDEMEVAKLFNMRLVSGCEEKLFFFFLLDQRKAVRDARSVIVTILLLKTYQKWLLC